MVREISVCFYKTLQDRTKLEKKIWQVPFESSHPIRTPEGLNFSGNPCPLITSQKLDPFNGSLGSPKTWWELSMFNSHQPISLNSFNKELSVSFPKMMALGCRLEVQWVINKINNSSAFLELTFKL